MPRLSSAISRVSAVYLGAVGLALLFASDTLLPKMIAGLPPDAAWLGQLVAGAWLGAAVTNWNGRNNLLGGVYGRPLVNLNLMLYMVGALALVKGGDGQLVLWLLTVPTSLLAIVYGALLLRGPFDPLTAG